MEANNLQLCRICISSHSNCTQMISIFGEDLLWKKITTLADVKIEKGDTLPQQVCVPCAKNAISACLFKKKCEDADNYFRQQLLIRKFEGRNTTSTEAPTDADIEAMPRLTETAVISDVEENDDEVDTGDGDGEGDGDGDVEGDDEHEAHDVTGHMSGMVTGDDGEIKYMNGKPSFDITSIRLMQEYMQQQLSKFNGAHNDQNGDAGSGGEVAGEEGDDDPLPLIPEIELITPSEDVAAMSGMDNSAAGTSVPPMRGYQCPQCFQIFEMKQILKAHMQSVHGTVGPVYECSNCKKTYFYKRFLEKHIRRGRCVKKRRNQTRPMQCSDCHVLFPTGHHLGWHKRTGCPSRAAKMPLQQLFKQNIVEYNNFPKRVGVRKPENAIYLHNRKLLMANNKRKGRTRIKLDSKKIALAKQLILREATTTVIANELNISRTFAWRLRKSLVNGVSLHERVIDPNVDEGVETTMEPTLDMTDQQAEQTTQHKHMGCGIKEEKAESDDAEEEEVEDGDEADVYPAGETEKNSRRLNDNETVDTTAHLYVQPYVLSAMTQMPPLTGNCVNVYGAQKSNNDDDEAEETDDDVECGQHQHRQRDKLLQQQKQIGQQQLQLQCQQQQQPIQNFKNNIATSRERDLNGIRKITRSRESNTAPELPPPPLLNHFSPAVAAAINQLPVNLSIRPLQSMQNIEITSKPQTSSSHTKKPRKPNVFIDDEKYAMAKTLVAQNSSTMEIARALNVSQMTAWKVRDAIVKGLPLSYRSKKDVRNMGRSDESNGTGEDAVVGGAEKERVETQTLHEQRLLIQQQQEHKEHKEEQQKFESRKHHEQELQQQTQPQQLHLMQQRQQLKQQQQHFQQQQQPYERVVRNVTNVSSNHKVLHPRRRLKAAEREQRDKEITREILELIKEDSNIQYWKVSARLAEKGFPISPSSVCQKLKSMGIHRRWKPGDKPPMMLDMEQLKVATAAAAAAANNMVANSPSADESYEQQFDMGGAHFLSAFTR